MGEGSLWVLMGEMPLFTATTALAVKVNVIF